MLVSVAVPGAKPPDFRLVVTLGATTRVVVASVRFLEEPNLRPVTRTFTFGKRSDTKRAIVTLAAGDRIELFES